MALSDTIARHCTTVVLRGDKFGETVSITPQATGTPRNVVVVIGPYTEFDFNGEGNIETQGETRELTISAKDNTEGIIDPKYRGEGGGGDTYTFTINGESKVFYAIKPLTSDRFFHRIVVSTSPTMVDTSWRQIN